MAPGGIGERIFLLSEAFIMEAFGVYVAVSGYCSNVPWFFFGGLLLAGLSAFAGLSIVMLDWTPEEES